MAGRRLTRFLRGCEVVEHVVTHAHGDHVGSTAWLCNHTGAPLVMSRVEADDFESDSIAYHAGAAGKYLVAPMGWKRRKVDRRLDVGDRVAGFEVLAQPGHSPGLLALWREADRTLLVGDSPINLSHDPDNPRWLHMPKRLHHNPDAAVASRWRLLSRPDGLLASMESWVDTFRHGKYVGAPRS